MTPRLRADVWVSGYMRSVRVQGGFAYLRQRGSAEAGSVLLKIEGPDQTYRVLSPVYFDDKREWMASTGPKPVSEADADSYIERRLKTDPDLWVVEVEDQQYRHFLNEPVEGDTK